MELVRPGEEVSTLERVNCIPRGSAAKSLPSCGHNTSFKTLFGWF